MPEFLRSISTENAFIPHGHCYLWQPELMWLNIVSDSLIALAYYSIAIALVYFVQKRRDLPYAGLFLLFSAFIIACGTTYIVEVWTLWHPTYWLSGFLKAFTAVVSVLTAIVLASVIPQALGLPSPTQLHTLNYDAVVITDLQGIILDWNPAAERLFGYAKSEVLSKTSAILYPSEEAARPLEIIQETIRQGRWSGESHFIRKDGSKGISEMITVLLQDERGQATAVIGVSRDITSSKALEREVVLREELLNAFFNAASTANVGLNILDEQLRFVRINQSLADVNGASVEHHIGKRVEEILPQIAPILLPMLQQALRTGKSIVNKEVKGEVPSCPGVNRDWLVSYFPIEQEGSTLKGIGTIVVEITKRKKAERKLKEAIAELARSNQELEQFAYVASHDLREPLRKIKSYTDLLAKRYQGQLDEKADKYIAYITDGAERMQTLITELLTYSRVAKGEISLEPINLGAILNRTLSDLSTAIWESNALIITDSLPLVKANPSQMGQLLQNLITNAIKFRGKEPPQIQIRAVREHQFWRISVQDNGIGIEPQYAERIFVIFQRLHTKEEYPGTGIGLAICKKIVERHGGQIWVESELGTGTTFFFTIPATE